MGYESFLLQTKEVAINVKKIVQFHKTINYERYHSCKCLLIMLIKINTASIQEFDYILNCIFPHMNEMK